MSDSWDELLDEAKADLLAQQRARTRWLGRQATEAATFDGTLLDLAEAGIALSISMLGGRRHEGRIVGLGHGVVLLRERSEHTAIRTPAIAVVRPLPGEASVVASGDRAAALDLGFTEVLARVVDDEPSVSVALATGDLLAGDLIGVGGDVLTLRTGRGADRLAYCSPSAVTSVRFRSG